MHRKRLAKFEAVKELLNLPHWKKGPDDSFDMELFRAVASMCTKKGLPNLEAVKKLLNWSRWYKPKPDGSFNRESCCCIHVPSKRFGSCREIAEIASLEEDDSCYMELFRAGIHVPSKRLAKFGSCREISELALLEEGAG